MVELTNIDFSAWNRNGAKFVAVLGVQAEKVVKFESAQLLNTLIRVTPPRDINKTKARIAKRIKAVFGIGSGLKLSKGSFFGNYLRGEAQGYVKDASSTSFEPNSASGMTWFAATPFKLYGLTPESNHWNDSVSEMEKYSLTADLPTRETYEFEKSMRPRQKVRIIKQRMADPDKVMDLIKKLQANVGRMKAGWLPAWDSIGAAIGRNIPQYVARHRSGARGYVVNNLHQPGNPNITIANNATAVAKMNEKGSEAYYFQKAVNLRARAMATNFSMIMTGKKLLSDYAKMA
jgi:hypothetical protein